MDKRVKECIAYYLKNIDTEQYKSEKNKAYANGEKVHSEYINEKKPQWNTRTDNYEDGDIAEVIIIDTLSNEGVGKLIKKLYSMPKKKFKVTNYFKKPTFTKKYDYVHLQYSHSQTGRFAEIELLDDSYLREIDISWSQINSYYAVIQYTFCFKKCLNDEAYSSFMRDNITKLSSKDYSIWYHICIDSNQTLDELLLTQMHSEYFPLLLQRYITTYLYTEQGKKNQLINIVCFTRETPIDINKMYLGDFSISFYNKKDNYVIIADYDEVSYSLLAGNNRIPFFSVTGYIANYGNEFYYHFNGIRELKIFEREFSKFSSGRKKTSYNKKFKDLLNKMQSITEYSPAPRNNFYKQFNSNWDFYISNDKSNLKDFHNKGKRINYQKIYQDNFAYMNILSNINYTKSNRFTTIIAATASIIAVIISVISLLA